MILCLFAAILFALSPPHHLSRLFFLAHSTILWIRRFSLVAWFTHTNSVHDTLMLVLFPVSPFSTQNVFWSFVAKIHPTPNTKPTVHLPRKQSTIPQARHHSLHGPVSQQILHSSLLLSHQLELTCCTLHAILFHFLFIFNSSIHPFNPSTAPQLTKERNTEQKPKINTRFILSSRN